jgi:hypothetical protein
MRMEIEEGSFYTYLPEGCEICREGGKLVLFITGECVHSCYYCPISEERKDSDVVYANERRVRTFEDVLEEIELMSAEGASITGGEPLSKPERTYEYLRFFKKYDLHVHLYTSIPAGWKIIDKLAENGLDEIRFHPVGLENVEKFRDSIRYAMRKGMSAGFEIPALYYNPTIAHISNELDCFVNLNELEFSSTNYSKLRNLGYEVDEFYGAVGSYEIAEKYARSIKKFHYCTAKFKDGVQLRRRLLRMALNHPEFYSVTEDGTIMCGFVRGDSEKIQKAIDFLNKVSVEFTVVYGSNEDGDEDILGVETGIDVVKKWKKELKNFGLDVSIIERYPTSKRIVVEVEPL